MEVAAMEHRPALRSNERRLHTYADIHRLLGLRRVTLHELIGLYRDGEHVDPSKYSFKERVGALEALLFDDFCETRLAVRRFRNPGVHGLGFAYDPDGDSSNFAVESLFFTQREEFPVSEDIAVQCDDMSQMQYDRIARIYKADPSYRDAGIDVISLQHGNTLLCELLGWEKQKMTQNKQGPNDTQLEYYNQYVDLLYQYRPDRFVADLHFPAVRRMGKGLLFGTPFQWNVIRRFPKMAEDDLGMQWGQESFDTLMNGLEPLTRQIAHIHSGVHMKQDRLLSEHGLDFSDCIQCIPSQQSAPLRVDPEVVDAVYVSLDTEGGVDWIRRQDDGPITACTAYYSNIFKFTREWNRAIARDIMLPSST